MMKRQNRVIIDTDSFIVYTKQIFMKTLQMLKLDLILQIMEYWLKEKYKSNWNNER